MIDSCVQRSAVVAILLVCLLAAGCSPTAPAQSADQSREEAVGRFFAVRQVVEGNTEFAVDLYHQLRTREGNLILSPFSISTALAMTYAGARGNTERQMAETLRFTLPQPELHGVLAELQAALQKARREGEVELTVANSLWPREGLVLRPSFLQVMEKDYRTSITPLDYANPNPARQRINGWVKEQTQDRIEELIQPGILSSDTVLVLANAVYFKGPWLQPFDPQQTRSAPFHVAPNRTVSVPTMQQTGPFGYAGDEEVQLLEMRYRGEDLSMVVIVPRAVDGLAAVERELTANKLLAWITMLGGAGRVEVTFPRFKTTVSLELREPLIALGMMDAFGNADFSGMFEGGGPRISAVVHQAFVSVDEAGTEAAAATAVIMTVSLPPSVRVDRPFLFLIRDRRTGSILFLGRIVDPTAA
jgi:serine protease inhibitor